MMKIIATVKRVHCGDEKGNDFSEYCKDVKMGDIIDVFFF